MKFCVENDLSLFEFHDSEFSFVSFDGKDLIVSASMVNIHKNTPQNPSDYDMEIAFAQITFKNFYSATYEPGRAWKTGEDGKSYPVGPQVIFREKDAIDRILEELQNEITVYHFEKEDRGYSIGGCGIEPYFTMEFDFDNVVVCWDEYKKKAWYELHRQYRYDAVLRTPNGDETVKLMVGCHEEPVYYKGSLEQPPTVNVGCTFEGKEYWGHGSDYLWIDAFADLQRQLPEGVLLKCCLTCRHGNLCPVGNDKNEVFCTKDVLITQKSDLYYYTEDDREREKRSRQYCSSCEEYQPQTDDFYTYNDYLHYLEKASTPLPQNEPPLGGSEPPISQKSEPPPRRFYQNIRPNTNKREDTQSGILSFILLSGHHENRSDLTHEGSCGFPQLPLVLFASFENDFPDHMIVPVIEAGC